MGDPHREHVLPGTIYAGVPPLPILPQFIPIPGEKQDSSRGPEEKPSSSPQPAAAMDWDTTVVVHGRDWPQIDADRRHSGWEEVERRWAKHKQDQQQQMNTAQANELSSNRNSNRNSNSAHLTRGDNAESTTPTIPVILPCPHISIATPGLEYDFRMRVRLNSQSVTMAVGDGGFKKWTTFTEGEWSGRLGHGVVVSGGQDSRDLVYGKTLATQAEATHRLKTADLIPAFIECKTRGFLTGPPELMRALQDPEKAESVDARLLQYRVTLSMKTTDERYAEKVNASLWVGSCFWRGAEVIYDVYKIT